MRIVIIDDKEKTRQKIRNILQMLDQPKVEIVGEAEGVASGEALIRAESPDLVLLDVEMNDGTGFDLLEAFDEPNFGVILITAHDRYAVRAFKVSAIDYVLKPVNPVELHEAIRKAATYKQEYRKTSIQNLLANQHKKKSAQKLILSDTDNFYLVDASEIIRCQAESNYTRFFLTESRSLLIAKTLKEYIEVLDEQVFFRVHRSHLINLNFFDRLEKKDGGTIHLKDGSTLPVAPKKKEELFEALRTL
ncbi:MAG: LytTR family DNA-binding domain-containing protein [Bacteroidota bacterium]